MEKEEKEEERIEKKSENTIQRKDGRKGRGKG